MDTPCCSRVSTHFCNVLTDIRSYEIGLADLLRQIIQRNELLVHLRTPFVTNLSHIAHDDRRETAQPITVHHHAPTRTAFEGCLKMGWVDDASVLSWQTSMGSDQFMIGKQVNAIGVNAC